MESAWSGLNPWSWFDTTPTANTFSERFPTELAGAAVDAGISPPTTPSSGNVGGSFDPFATTKAAATPAVASVNAPAVASVPATTTPTAETVPLPTARPASAPQSTEPATEATKQPSTSDRLLSALKGVKAPTTPEATKVATPRAPTVQQVRGTDLISFIQGLQKAQNTAKARTLAQSLRG